MLFESVPEKSSKEATSAELPSMWKLCETESWDLSAVINLIHSLSVPKDEPLVPNLQRLRSKSLHYAPLPELQEGKDSSLGNFDEIWEFLGQPRDVPPPMVNGSLQVDPYVFSGPEEVHVTADDSGNDNANAKAVRWRDEAEGADLEDNDQQDGLDATTTGPRLTKTQRKKQRRRLQKEQEGEAFSTAQLPVSGNQSDSVVEQQSRTRRALIQQITNAFPAQGRFGINSRESSHAFVENRGPNGIFVGNGPFPFIRAQSAPSIPAVQPVPNLNEVNLAVAATKKAILLSKLKAQFFAERPFLENLSISQHTTNGTEASVKGIHVFVDISNILIGFHDALKVARGLSIHTRIRRQTLSFHNLSLILERGRPAAKRVLVGSDNIDSIQEASHLGYETNILDRVHKAKPLTPGQKRHLQPPNPSTTNLHSGQSSGSETTATHGPEKWVEQAVDEILHLKILESVVDAQTPSTIVLATGDAAEAEYSGGFLRMVERALAKGWWVEVVSFRHNTSGAYRRREFRAIWEDRFRIVELDPFVEELLGGQA
ncbi:hypothetical protein MMC11_007306 [Xylographa trunciseda]|nr:hypothetical protein [Xylographa trunciseda]